MEAENNVIEYNKQNQIGFIHLNHPPLNIITKKWVKEMLYVLEMIEKDKELKVVLLYHDGKCFSAGADVNDMLDFLNSNTYVSVKMHTMITIADRLAALPVPTIAAIDGMALGGGFELALACDFRIIGKNGKLALTEIDFDSFPGMGGVPRLIQLVGYSRAMEMILFAEELDAEKAYREGVVNAVAEEESAYEAAVRWAELLAGKARIGLAATKEMAHCLQEKERGYLYLISQSISQRVADSGALHKQSQEFLNRKSKKKIVKK